MAIYSVTQQDWDEGVVTKPTVPVLLWFFASWCGPCRRLEPVLEELNDESGAQYAVMKVDTDRERALTRKHRVSALPTCLVFRRGEETDRIVGVRRKEVYLGALSGPTALASPLPNEGDDMAAKKGMKSAPKGAFDWMSFALTIAMQILAKLSELLNQPKAKAAAAQGTSCDDCAADIREQVTRLNAVADKLDQGVCDHSCCEEVNCVQACLLLTTMKMHNCCD